MDPAHLWDRSRGGCDHPLCVVPLCRACHRLFDDHALDILPPLLDGDFFAQMGHVIEVHEVSPLSLLERVTGVRWQPAMTTGGR